MRLYDGRFVKRFIDRKFKSHTTSRDGIVWDYDETNHLVRCKIQGTDEYIVCHYPRNFRTKEEWCKRGNSVRIEHKGGVKGYLEVVGHGRAIPSPVAGSTFPTPETLADVVTSMGAITPFGGMTIEIEATTYRIDGLAYSLNTGTGYLVMGSDDPGAMGTPGALPMGASDNQYVTFATAPAEAYWRYDLVVAGEDGLVDVITGTPSNNNTTGPTMPTTPADHVKLFHVLIVGGRTEITVDNINQRWETRRLQTLDVGFSGSTISGGGAYDSTMNWDYLLGLTSLTCTVTISLRDQYGWLISSTLTPYSVYNLHMSIPTGSGTLSQSSLQVAQGSANVIYTREGPIEVEGVLPQFWTSGEMNPSFLFTEQNSGLGATATLALIVNGHNMIWYESLGMGD